MTALFLSVVLTADPARLRLRHIDIFTPTRDILMHFKIDSDSRIPGALLLVTCTLSLSSSLCAGEIWKGFRGPVPLELSSETLPVSWSPDAKPGWTASIPGYGQSSPVVAEDVVYVTSIEGPNKEECHVTAFSLESGEELWRKTVANASPIENSSYVSRAAPTPLCNDSGVVALFEGGNLLSLSRDGSLRWERNLVEEYGPVQSRHGLAASLAETADHFIVWMERAEDPYILAVNKETGETDWKVSGLGTTSWSTPIVLDVEGVEQIVLSGNGLLRGIAAETGETLWSFEEISGNTSPSPSVVGEGLVLVGATVGRGEASGGRASSSNGLIRISKNDSGEWQAAFEWQARRATCSFGSPLAHDGYAYFVNAQGVLYCINLETGEEAYVQRTPQSVWATPIGVGDRIYLFGQTGTTTVLKSGPEFEVLAENRLWEDAPKPAASDETEGRGGRGGMGQSGPIQYAAAAVPGHLLIRTGDTLHCVTSE